MKNLIHLLVLFITGLFLASCGIFGSNETAVPNQVAALATNTAPTDKVTVELATQVDLNAQYNTVGQIVRFKYIVKMVKNDLTENLPANPTFAGVTPFCPAVNTIGNLNDRFDAGEILECTYDLILTQADLDKGSVSNVATVTVYLVNSNTVTTTVPTVSSKKITLSKTASPQTFNAAGQTITYTYVIQNSGTIPLGPAQFTITDTGINNNTAFNCGNADATIAPGASLTCSATYTITSADLSLTSITSNAVASGGGATSSQPASATITKAQGNTASGTTVQHTVVDGEWLWQIARCYGTDPQKTVEANPQVDPQKLRAGMVVTVPNVGSKGTVHAPPQPCVSKHLVQTGDTWTSIAQKYGADPGLTQMVNSNILTVGKEVKVPLYTQGLNIPLVNTPSTPTTPSSSTLILTVNANPTTYSQVSQVITFNYIVKNNGTGNLGPAQFTVTDSLFGNTPINCGPANTTLSPGASVNCASTYTVTQANVDSASFASNATASGGGAPTSPAVQTTITKSTSPLTVSVIPSPTTFNAVGQTISLTYLIKNNGSATLGPGQFIVSDTLINNNAAFNCGAADTTLSSGATVTCTTTYSITQANMDAGIITSVAVASGGGAAPSQSTTTTINKQ